MPTSHCLGAVSAKHEVDNVASCCYVGGQGSPTTLFHQGRSITIHDGQMIIAFNVECNKLKRYDKSFINSYCLCLEYVAGVVTRVVGRWYNTCEKGCLLPQTKIISLLHPPSSPQPPAGQSESSSCQRGSPVLGSMIQVRLSQVGPGQGHILLYFSLDILLFIIIRMMRINYLDSGRSSNGQHLWLDRGIFGLPGWCIGCQGRPSYTLR